MLELFELVYFVLDIHFFRAYLLIITLLLDNIICIVINIINDNIRNSFVGSINYY